MYLPEALNYYTTCQLFTQHFTSTNDYNLEENITRTHDPSENPPEHYVFHIQLSVPQKM